MTTQSPNIEPIFQENNLYLQAKHIVEGFMLGLHKSPYHGFSVEFSQHRPYQFGDEIRHLDWKLYGKTDRLYIKQFREETNLSAYILLDSSKSMSFSSHRIRKYDYASQLAASLAYLLVKQKDAAGLCIFSHKINKLLPPKALPSQAIQIIKSIQTSSISGSTHISNTLHNIAERFTKRGLIILISDLWDDPDEILSGWKHLRYQGHEMIVFHIWDPLEINLDIHKKIQFIDSENNEKLKLDTRKIKREYSSRVRKHIRFFRDQSGELDIDYTMLKTTDDLNISLSEYLIKRSKLY